MKGRGRNSRQGMALLTVLLMVAVMAGLAVVVLDDVRFSIRRTTNAEMRAQGQAYAAGAQALALRQIERLSERDPTRTPVSPEWNGRTIQLPIEAGMLSAVIRDGQTCFNLNSLVEGQGEVLVARPEAAARFIALGRAVGVDEGRMRALSDALIDWMDSDAAPRPLGAEDAAYAGGALPYRTGGAPLAEVSEMRAVRGVDADLYRRLRPYVCALPETGADPATINVNSLTEETAPLLTAISEGRVSVAAARAAIAARPRDGWASANAFWAQPALRALNLPLEIEDLTGVQTRYFNLTVHVEHGGSQVVRTALLQVRPDGSAQTVIQRWTLEE